MKQKMKHYLGIAVMLLGILTCFNGCHKDDFKAPVEETGNSKVKLISLADFNDKVVKSNNYEKLNSLFETNKLAQFRLTVTDSASISTDEIFMFEREDKTFFTFRIETNIDNKTFYNLLVVTNNIGQIEKTRILKYSPSQIWLSDTSQPFSGQLNIEDNNIFADEDLNNITSSRGDVPCIVDVEITSSCNLNGEGHYNGHPECTHGTSWNLSVTVQYGPCESGSIGGGNGSEGSPINSGNSSGGGGGPSSNTNNQDDENDCVPAINNPCDDDETVVIPPKQTQEKTTHEKNCEELNKLTSPPAYDQPNPYLDDDNAFNTFGLNTTPRLAIINADQSLDNAVETGFGLFNQSDFLSWGPYARYTSANNQTHHVEFIAYPTQFGSVHTHPFNTTNKTWIPMFSLDDIYSVLTFRNVYSSIDYLNDLNTNGDALFTSILIAKQGDSNNTYAIKIDDITKFQKLKDVYDDIGDANDDGIDEYEKLDKKLEELYVKNANNTSGTATQYQRVLLKFLADNDLGVSLYQMEQTNSGTPDVEETWKRLNLGLGDTVINSPCN